MSPKYSDRLEVVLCAAGLIICLASAAAFGGENDSPDFFSSEAGKRLISQAAAIPKAEFAAAIKPEKPRPTSYDNQPLSLVFLFDKPQPNEAKRRIAEFTILPRGDMLEPSKVLCDGGT